LNCILVNRYRRYPNPNESRIVIGQQIKPPSPVKGNNQRIKVSLKRLNAR